MSQLVVGCIFLLVQKTKLLKAKVKQRREKKTRARTRGNPQKRNRRQTQFMENDGMETISVEPEAKHEGHSVRRSKWTRIVMQNTPSLIT